MNEIGERRAKKLQFLKLIYEKTGGSTLKGVHLFEVSDELGLTHDDADEFVVYWGQQGYVEATLGQRMTRMTVAGIAFIEGQEVTSLPEPASPPVEPEVLSDRRDTYCRLLTRENVQPLNLTQYSQLVEERDNYELFIDGLTHEVRCREDQGNVRITKLRPKEFGILRDFIKARKPMRLLSTETGRKCANIETARRLFEEARRKSDVKLGRYEYRCFRLQKSEAGPEFNTYEFAPPPDLKYCLILPA